jgi:hypothetical protein
MNEATAFIPPHALNTAVLFLVFNRLDTTRQVFEAIRQAKPPRLYVAADGARTNKEGEADKAQAVRDYIMQNVDWECEVKTMFRERNLGCKMAVSGAIDWFFENEEMGIILEDDCLPSQSFFWFCEELLERYKDDMRIGHIAGYNHFPGRVTDSTYFYFLVPGIWGWASWSNRWCKYNVHIEDSSREISMVATRFSNANLSKCWVDIFKKIGTVDTWDYQWLYALLKNGFLTIRPSLNLVSNIGLGEGATHTVTKNVDISNNKGVEIDCTCFIKPNAFILDVEEENIFYKVRMRRSIIVKLSSSLKKFILNQIRNIRNF